MPLPINEFMIRIQFFVLLFILCSLNSNAKVLLPEILSDNMVLKQNSTVLFWGEAEPNASVSIEVSWSKIKVKTTASKTGQWEIELKTPQGSFDTHWIKFCDRELTEIKNILIGEVWYCSGQSNMEMPMKGYPNQPIAKSDQYIESASSSSGVRMVKVKRNTANSPIETATGKWQMSTPENVKWFSATAYYFALELTKQLQVPIGIINCSWGGTPIESWLTADKNKSYFDYANYLVKNNEPEKMPSVLYNGMFHPIKKYVVSGVIWYQGEANVDRSTYYESKLNDLISIWRLDFKVKNLPVFVVELAPYQYADSSQAYKIRQAQYNVTQHNQNTFLIGTNDLIDSTEYNIIHPSNKHDLGLRCATLVSNTVYTEDNQCALHPTIASITRQPEGFLIQLQNTCDSIQFESNYIGFELSDGLQTFRPSVLLQSDRKSFLLTTENKEILPKIKSINYCYQNCLQGNVRNSKLLPLIPFSYTLP